MNVYVNILVKNILHGILFITLLQIKMLSILIFRKKNHLLINYNYPWGKWHQQPQMHAQN